MPDVAYHLTKCERGFHKAINIQGTDHHGTIARVRAGLQAAGVGIPPGYPDYVLHKMVTVMRGGEEVKISKRAGSYVTLRDLIDWTSRDAVRFFLLSRKADTEFVFDVDLALKAEQREPGVLRAVRPCAHLLGAGAVGAATRAACAGADLSLLTAPTETALMLQLADYPDDAGARRGRLRAARRGLLPARAGRRYHSYYDAERFLVDDAALARARLALLAATRQVLHNGLAVLGVSAPASDERARPRAEP